MNQRLVVYTALFGDYDDLIEPKVQLENCDFICFTDQKYLQSDIWEIRIIETYDLPRNMMNRLYKWLPHKYLQEYEQSLYVDTNIILLIDVIDLFDRYLVQNLISIPKHYARDCIYEEAEVCILYGKSNFFETANQIKKYANEEYPPHFGLGANRVIFRKHMNIDVIKLMESVWSELNINKTKRDQLSLFYCCWKNDIKVTLLEDTFYSVKQHNNEKNSSLFYKIKKKLMIIKRRYFDILIYRFLLKV